MSDHHGGTRSEEGDKKPKNIQGDLTLHGTIQLAIQHQTTPKASQPESYCYRKNTCLEIAEIFFSVLIGGALVVVGVLQWLVYSQQAHIMEGQNSALLAYGGTASYNENLGTANEAYVQWITIKNSGGGLAKVSDSWVNLYRTPEPISDNYDFHNLAGVESVRTDVPPQGAFESSPYRVTKAEIERAKGSQLYLYIYATIIYSDGYNPRKLTMFCFQVRPFPLASGGFIANLSPCKHHNCTDQNCEGEPRASLLPPS